MALTLCLLFFVSGASALIFETLWFHQASLALGSSVWASSLVLAGFMAGLALGNALSARYGRRIVQGLRSYALLELAVAASGVLIVFVLPALGGWLAPLSGSLASYPWLLNGVRLLVGFIAFLLPSTAMGMTLPILTGALAANEPSFARVLGRLYGWNTLGAVVGALSAPTLLVARFGVRRTALIAAALNVVAAIGAWLLARKHGQRSTTPAETPSSARASRTRGLLWAAFLCGATLLALEVVWFRLLALYVPSRALSFALLLAVVLSGIALGGLAASWAARRSARFHESAASLAFAAGALSVLSYAASPWVVDQLNLMVVKKPVQILELGLPLIFPVSALSGGLFTAIGAALKQTRASATEATGELTLFNTAGAAVGSMLAGFVLLPRLGIENSLFFLALAYGAAGSLLLYLRPERTRVTRAALLVFVLAALAFPFGQMRGRHLERVLTRWGKQPDARVWVREGLNETVVYLERRFAGEPVSYRLITNAVAMSSSDFRNRRYMKLFVYLPIALHPKPRRALLISYGVGATAKALTDTRELSAIDVVDISREILELSSVVYPDPRQNPLRDPRVSVHVEDGRQFLQITPQGYDLITAEPPPPDLAGVVNLYSREFFQLVYSRLNEGGVASYWLPIHSLSEQNSLAVVKGFCQAFTDCSLWHGIGPDLMLLGTRNASGHMTDAQLRRQWRDAKVSVEMKALGLERPEQLGALFIGDARYLAGFTADADAVTDDYPERIVPERGYNYFGQHRPASYLAWMNAGAAQRRFAESAFVARFWTQQQRAAARDYFQIQGVLNDYSSRAEVDPMADLRRADAVLRDTDLTALALWLLGSNPDIQAAIERLPAGARSTPEVQLHIGIGRLARRDYGAAANALQRALAEPAARRLYAYALCRSGDRPAAERVAPADFWRFAGPSCGRD